MNNPLKTLYDAEDFLDYYQVAYNSKIVKVVRLHLLKQYRTYLEQEELLDSNPSDPEIWEKQRRLLIKAYQDFVNRDLSKPAAKSVFQQTKQNTSSACSTCSSTVCKL